LIVSFVVVGVLVITNLTGKENIDILPEESSEIDYGSQARIIDGEELFDSLGGPEPYDSLSKDLFVFAKTAYPEYKNNDTKVVGFKLTSEISITLEDISFKGKYGSSNNDIVVRVKLLKNKRIKTTITDKKTALNVDSSLPSNTSRNQFIGTLPILNDNFSIEYNEADDKFLLSLFSEDSSILDSSIEEASKIITTSLGITGLENAGLDILRVGFNTSTGQ